VLNGQGVPEQPPRFSYAIGRLDRALRDELDRRLEPFGLSWPQYTALSVLRWSAGLSNAQLARHSYVTPQTMIEVTKALERAGYITRSRSPSHGRVLESRLTASGKAELEACDEAIDTMEREMLAGISRSQQAVLIRQILGCVRNLRSATDARGRG
jgi:DNA-binding MarR family transcriptional regulator